MVSKAPSSTPSRRRARQAGAPIDLATLPPAELAALQRHLLRGRSSLPGPWVKRGRKGEIVVDHPDPDIGLMLLAESLGAKDAHVAWDQVTALGRILATGERHDETDLNAALDLARSLAPATTAQMILALRIAATDHLCQVWTQRCLPLVGAVAPAPACQILASLERSLAKLIASLDRLQARKTGMLPPLIILPPGSDSILTALTPTAPGPSGERAADDA